MCNLNPNKSETIEIEITGNDFASANGQIITSDKMNNYNDFGKQETVSLKDFEVAKPKNGKLTVELPSKSVVLVQLQ
jgi:alpha-N-arabinofuranosidase